MKLKRTFDAAVAAVAIAATSPIQALVALAVLLTSRGPVLYRSERVGLNNDIFVMMKFRSMKADTPELATHLLENRDQMLTPVGRFLRTTSLDELPQLWHVLGGSMSLVGPRPALHNQDDLIGQRSAAGVHTLKPGITGLAQITGRDDLSIAEKVEMDREYLETQSFSVDLMILLKTLAEVTRRSGITG